MTGKVKNLRRNSVYYTSEFLGAYNQKNVIVINPAAPDDIEGKLYRSPDDANTWIATQSPAEANGFVLKYGGGTYADHHTVKSRILGEGIFGKTALDSVSSDVDFAGDNFFEAIVKDLQVVDLQIATGKISAMLNGVVSGGTVDGIFACLGVGGVSQCHGVDFTNAIINFFNGYQVINCTLTSGSFNDTTIEDSVIGSNSSFYRCDITNDNTFDATSGGYEFTDCTIQSSLLSGIPAGSTVVFKNCQFLENFAVGYDALILNCYSDNSINIEVTGAGAIVSSCLSNINIINTNGGRTANRGDTIDNTNFTNLTEDESQALFEEIDTMIGGGADNNFYGYQGATPSGRLYGTFDNLYNEAQAIYGVKNVWISGSPPLVFQVEGSHDYDLSNRYIRGYGAVDGYDQIGYMQMTTNDVDKCFVSLPRVVENMNMQYINNGATTRFHYFTNQDDRNPIVDIKGKSIVQGHGTGKIFVVGSGSGAGTLTLHVRDTSQLIASGLSLFSLYSSSDIIHIHLYDQAWMGANVVALSSFISTGSGSTKKNVFIHIHSPYVSIDNQYTDSEDCTIVFEGWYKNTNSSYDTPTQVTDSITDVVWDNGNQQVTYTGTFVGLTVGDWIEMTGIDPSGYNILGQIIDFPTATEAVIQFPTTYGDPGTYVSGGSYTLKKVISLGYMANADGFKYVPRGAGFNIKLFAEVAGNNNLKKINIIARDWQNWNNATLYKNNDINSGVGDALDLDVDILVQQVQPNSIQSTARQIEVATTPSTDISILKYISGLSLQNTELFVVMEGEASGDISIKNLSVTPC